MICGILLLIIIIEVMFLLPNLNSYLNSKDEKYVYIIFTKYRSNYKIFLDGIQWKPKGDETFKAWVKSNELYHYIEKIKGE